MHSKYQSIASAALTLSSLASAHESGLNQPQSSPDLDLLPRQATASTPRPLLGPVPYSVAITNCVVPNAVALTYDDGPGPYTSQLLDTLAANGIHATFFILGCRSGSIGPVDQAYPDVIKRMYQAGHQIASHTWDHQSLESLTQAQRISEMTKNEAAFNNILGFFPTYMRPPYGFCYGPSGCLSDMASLGYHVIDWSVDTKDYDNDSPDLIVNAERNWDAAFQSANPATSSFIPLTHDIHQNTVTTLAPYMISEIKARGYKFLTVGECLGDPVQNWYRNPTTGSAVSNAVGGSIAKANNGAGVGSSSANSSSSTSSSSSASSSSSSSTKSPTSTSSLTSSTHSAAAASATPTAHSNSVRFVISLPLVVIMLFTILLHFYTN